MFHKHLLYIINISGLCPVQHFKFSETHDELKKCPHSIRILEINIIYEEHLHFQYNITFIHHSES